MKLSELTPCVICGGKLVPIFYRVTVEQMMIDAQATNQVLGLNTIFGGAALRLAEAMAPTDDVTITLQKGSGLVCQDCFIMASMNPILFREESEDAAPGAE